MMKAERFRQIRNLFDAAMAREPESRNTFLQEACQGDEDLLMEVGKLLAAQGQPTAWIDESVLGMSLARLEGTKIGPYEILRHLGEGGMGAVYLAAHDAAGERRLVALKIVRQEALSSEVLRRFKREREILESLDHPNIARVLGGGTTEDGLPYLVMDYVDGQPIHTYCDERHLDLRARIKLFRDVCSAVQYAHEKHIVHRDLKPSNILVTADGTVKLLDFGIARVSETGPGAATCLTVTDLMLMTPEYASPEQVSGATVTPASDVYALGVILYELLTGRRPYRLRSRLFKEIARVICEETPERPSIAAGRKPEAHISTARIAGGVQSLSKADLRKRLAGNIDSILLKALEKDPVHRYTSARQFSEDLRLNDEGRIVKARRSVFLSAVERQIRTNGWWFAVPVALALGMYANVISVPVEAWFLLAGITLVFIVGYYLGTWERGQEYTRKKLSTVAKAIPILAIAVSIEMWVILRIPRPEPALKIGISLIVTAAVLVAFVYALSQWHRRDRLGPLVLELDSKVQKISGVVVCSVLVFFLSHEIITDGFSNIDDILAFISPLPLFALGFVVRPQIRQRGLVGIGVLIPWTSILSYGWETGGGRIEGKFDILHLRRKWLPIGETYIPVAERDRIDALLKQQLMEWPA